MKEIVQVREKIKNVFFKKLSLLEQDKLVDDILQKFWCDAHDEGFEALKEFEKENRGK